MASGLYDNGRNLFALAGVNWTQDTTPGNTGSVIMCALIDAGVYTANLAADVYYDDNVDSAEAKDGTVGTSGTLTKNVAVAGVCDAADITYTAVTGSSVEGLVLYKFDTADTSSPLIAWVTFTAVTPNGGDISIQWDAGANKIFKL